MFEPQDNHKATRAVLWIVGGNELVPATIVTPIHRHTILNGEYCEVQGMREVWALDGREVVWQDGKFYLLDGVNEVEVELFVRADAQLKESGVNYAK